MPAALVNAASACAATASMAVALVLASRSLAEAAGPGELVISSGGRLDAQALTEPFQVVARGVDDLISPYPPDR